MQNRNFLFKCARWSTFSLQVKSSKLLNPDLASLERIGQGLAVVLVGGAGQAFPINRASQAEHVPIGYN
jgi:hypothetical protein